MKTSTTYRSTFLITLGITGLFMLLLGCTSKENTADQENLVNRQEERLVATDDKHKGAHVFGIKDHTDFGALAQQNLEWITLVSWGFQDDYDSPLVSHHDGDSLNILQHDSMWLCKIELVREAGFKVFFKPHLWVISPSNGKWRSDIYPSNEENWELWKSSYRNFILRYAKIAEQANAEMYCIGAEFSRLAVEKPEFWKKLIQEVRRTYSGKITYAANWYNEFEKIDFWNKLDFIGIQAYFPLVTTNNPSVKEISKGWNKYLPVLESTHKKYNRKVLFTEMGYKSTANGAKVPWEWLENASTADNPFSAETQANSYSAFFNTVWNKEWFAGVHIWQMRSDYVKDHEKDNLDFTPQGKPAENIIAKGFE